MSAATGQLADGFILDFSTSTLRGLGCTSALHPATREDEFHPSQHGQGAMLDVSVGDI